MDWWYATIPGKGLFACYDVAEGRMTDDPSYGITYLQRAFDSVGLDIRWWYHDEAADHGMTREEAVAILESR